MTQAHCRVLAVTIAIAALGGCSFVEVEPAAEDVLVLEQARVKDCERLGQTRVSVAAEVGFVERRESKVRQDLEALARNSAAEMGGDSVSPLTAIEAGKQTYGIYDCVRE